MSDYDLIPEPHREIVRLYNEGLQYLKDLLDLGLSDPDEAEIKLSGLKKIANDWHDLVDEKRRELETPHPGGWNR